MTDPIPVLEELRAIRRMVAETRRSTERHWIGLVIWGVPAIVASLVSQHLVTTSRYDLIGFAWMGFSLAGFVLSALYSLRERGRPRIVTTATRILDVTWFAVLVTMTTLMFSGAVHPAAIPGAIALVLASGLCIMGVVLEFRPLYAAAALWWVGGLVMMAHPQEAFAVEVVMLLLGYLLPAALLWRATARDDADRATD